MTAAGMQALVRELLEYPTERPWTTQGLGMLRTYLTPDRSIRLHVWDPALRRPKVSDIHTHPWDLHSTVIAGHLMNVKFAEKLDGLPHLEQTIKCGEGGGLCGAPRPTRLEAVEFEVVVAGRSYTQRADEIHLSKPETGTVTLVERTFGSDVDHAKVFWPAGEKWVDAEPREAREAEVLRATRLALEWYR